VTITLYSRPECGQCEQTKKVMDRKGLSYNEINVDEDEDARKLVQESAEAMKASPALPMVVVTRPGKGEATVWHGFRYDELKDLTKHS
jgi:glutaredoxin-like protein NrdH